MSQYPRIRGKPSSRRRRVRTAETGWGRTERPKAGSWIAWLVCGTIVAGVITVVLMPAKEARRVPVMVQEVIPDQISEGLEAAEAVARAFLAESEPARRLQWVRKVDEVSTRLAEYPDEARSATGKIDSVLGHSVDAGRSVTGFVVEFPSGSLRLLEVVGTPEGPRVDWDAYARHGSASWEDLWSGEAGRAVVRVFCEPATERPEPFSDQEKWTCFRLSGPDMPQALLGFADTASVREAMMKQAVLDSPNYRQRFTLEIVRHQGRAEPLFEIVRCLAVGWIRDERDVEELWIEQAARSR